MSGIVLRIVFHGLILFVPGPPDPSPKDHLTAYLVNAGQVPPRASGCVHKHLPLLEFRAAPADCVAGGCQAHGRQCSCSLQQNEILIQPAAVGTGKPLSHGPPPPLPNATSETDFSYLVNLDNLKVKADLNDLNGASPTGVVARLTIPFTSVTTCHLATRAHPGQGDWIHAFNFRRLGDNVAGSVTQAVAQALIAESTLPASSPVTVQLATFGKAPIGKPIKLVPELCGTGSESCIEIWLSNARDDSPDKECDDGTGRDFAFFSRLKFIPPVLWEASLVPQVDDSRKVQLPDAKTCADYMPTVSMVPHASSTAGPESRDVVTVVSRPVCPMAVYYPR
jgi:hypothetical protein